MPNWCEGSLRIRGRGKDIYEFLTTEITAIKGSEESNIKDIDTIYSEYDDEVSIAFCFKGEHRLWLNNSRRVFFDDGEVELHPNSEALKSAAFVIKQAWDIEIKQFVSVSKKYNLDMNISAFEKGQQFQREIQIRKGFVQKDEIFTYDDWTFECPCPLLGG